MTAKLVRSTIEKSWSRKASPIRHAASRSDGQDRLDPGQSAPNPAPEPLRRHTAAAGAKQDPRLDQHVVACYEAVSGTQHLRGAGMAAIAAVGGGGVKAPRRLRSASPRSIAVRSANGLVQITVLLVRHVGPPESNRPKIPLGSERWTGLPRSWSSALRT